MGKLVRHLVVCVVKIQSACQSKVMHKKYYMMRQKYNLTSNLSQYKYYYYYITVFYMELFTLQY